jgi:hypothetical protein
MVRQTNLIQDLTCSWLRNLGFEVLIMAAMKSATSWDVMPCILADCLAYSSIPEVGGSTFLRNIGALYPRRQCDSLLQIFCRHIAGPYLHRTAHIEKKCRDASMLSVGFEPTIQHFRDTRLRPRRRPHQLLWRLRSWKRETFPFVSCDNHTTLG